MMHPSPEHSSADPLRAKDTQQSSTPPPLTTAEIIAAGAELLTPFRADTNSLYLTRELNELGIEVVRKTIIGDEKERLALAIARGLQENRLVLVTGGLGPTEDDVTRPAAARALGVPLVRDPEQEGILRAWFDGRQTTMPERNLRQAEMLAGATALPNALGTAPGQYWEKEGRVLVLLPGPPRELQPMWREQARPRLRERAPAAGWLHRTLRLGELGESRVDEAAAPIYTQYSAITTTILTAQPGEIELHLRAPNVAGRAEQVAELADRLASALAGHLVSAQGESLERVVISALAARGQTLAVAESCTGGMAGERLTRVPGASQVFNGGIIAYTNAVKQEMLGVEKNILEREGAVSEACVRAMARGARRLHQSDWGLAITGIAGPEGGSREKPVGTVWLGCAGPDEVLEVRARRFHGERERVRQAAVFSALWLLWQTLNGTM